MKKYKNIFTVFCFSLFIVHSYAQDTPTQYEGGSVQEKEVKSVTIDYEAQVADLLAQIQSISCENKKGMVRLKCRGKIRGLEAQIRVVKKQQEVAELAQHIKELNEKNSELAQEDKSLDTEISEQAKRIDRLRKESAKKDLTTAALKVIQEAAKNMGK